MSYKVFFASAPLWNSFFWVGLVGCFFQISCYCSFLWIRSHWSVAEIKKKTNKHHLDFFVTCFPLYYFTDTIHWSTLILETIHLPLKSHCVPWIPLYQLSSASVLFSFAFQSDVLFLRVQVCLCLFYHPLLKSLTLLSTPDFPFLLKFCHAWSSQPPPKIFLLS